MESTGKFSITSFLFKPVHPATLGVFRIFFGVTMFWQVMKFYHGGLIWNFYTKPVYTFPFDFASWLPLFSDGVMNILLALLALATVAVTVGLFFRVAIILVTVLFSYFWLLEMSLYNNHYYLISLLSFLLIFTDADKWGSASAFFKKKKNKPVGSIPYWQIGVLQLQVFIVYFYGGLAKINADWFAGQPIRIILNNIDVTSENMVWFICYSGLLFDLLIGFLLFFMFFKKPGKIVTIAVTTGLVAFHAVNFFYLFGGKAGIFSSDIGVFSLFMVCATILYAQPSWPHYLLKGKQSATQSWVPKTALPNKRKLIVGGIALYFLIQGLLPFRHFLYPGNPEWTGEGHSFAWRMKMMNRKGTLKIRCFDAATGQRYPVDLNKILTPEQLANIRYYPKMVYQLSQNIEAEMREKGMANPVINMEYMISLNGRKPQLLFSTSLNLAEVEWHAVKHAGWLLSLENKLPSNQ